MISVVIPKSTEKEKFDRAMCFALEVLWGDCDYRVKVCGCERIIRGLNSIGWIPHRGPCASIIFEYRSGIRVV